MEKFGIFDLLSALGTSFGEGEAAPEAREQAPAKREEARRQPPTDGARNAAQTTEAARSCEGFLRRHEEISRRIDRNNRG